MAERERESPDKQVMPIAQPTQGREEADGGGGGPNSTNWVEEVKRLDSPCPSVLPSFLPSPSVRLHSSAPGPTAGARARTAGEALEGSRQCRRTSCSSEGGGKGGGREGG